MMRLCCQSGSFTPEFGAGQMDEFKFIDLCAQLDLDGVDIKVSSLRSLDVDHLKKIKRACLQRGLSVACVGGGSSFARQAEEQEAVHKQIRQGIEVAGSLGAPLLRLFAGYVSPGQKRELVWQRTVEGLKWAAEVGQKAGVVIGLQNHNHNNVTSTGDDVVRLLKEVNHPWCSHILDTGQYVGSLGAGGAKPEDPRQHDVYKSIERTAPLAMLVRAKLYRIKSGKEEWLDYDRIFKILRGVEYNGFVSLVYEGWRDLDAMHAVPLGVKFLRPYVMR